MKLEDVKLLLGVESKYKVECDCATLKELFQSALHYSNDPSWEHDMFEYLQCGMVVTRFDVERVYSF